MVRHRILPLLLFFRCFIILLPAALVAAIPQAERDALIALYQNTDGDTWTINDGWKDPPLHTDGFAMPGTEDAWSGITVEGEHVTGIEQFMIFNSEGTIPSELGNCINLNSLLLRGNRLTGTIPSELGNCSNLTWLDLANNNLSDLIPSELKNCPNLTSLDLGYNNFTGALPSWLGELLDLEDLRLDNNQLTGMIPNDLANCTHLHRLWLHSNQISGTIPEWIENFSELEDLRLGNNQLSGAIPSKLGNCSNLSYLYLNSNMLVGDIPDALANLTSLVPTDGLDLRWNALYTENSTLKSFLNSRQSGGDWETGQTIAPTGLEVTDMTISSVTLSWDQVSNTSLPGCYQVCYSRAGAEWLVYDETTDKLTTDMVVSGMDAGIVYQFSVKTKTTLHSNNSNTVISDQGDTLTVEIDPSLPVQLDSFTAEVKDNQVFLEWTTQCEVDNLGFILERSKKTSEPDLNETTKSNWRLVASYQTHSKLKGRGTTSEQFTYTFLDADILPGRTVQYRLSNVDMNGERNICDVIQIKTPTLPQTTRLESAYPNPFNPCTQIRYQLSEPGQVNICVYDMLGRHIKTLVNKDISSGQHHVLWNGLNDAQKQVCSGIYIIRMITNNTVQSHKVVLMR